MDEVLKIALTRELPVKTEKKKIAVSSELVKREEEGEGPQEPPLTH